MRQFTMVFSCFLLVSLAVAAACSSSSQGQAAPVSLSDAPASAINAYCSGYGSCCASKGFVFNDAACHTNLGQQLATAQICPAPRIYDPQAAGECFAELQATLSSCSNGPSATSSCNQMCNGTVPVGSPCTSTRDCAQPASGTVSCTPSGTTGTTVCAVQSHGKVGDGCGTTCTESADGNSLTCSAIVASSGGPTPSGTATCYTNDGLYCASDYICNSIAAVGGACTDYQGCVTGAYCNLTTSMCVAQVAAGAPCPTGMECDASSYCSTTQICVSKKAVGESCASNVECVAYCDTTTNLCVADNSTGLDVTAASCANPTGN